MNDTHGAMQSRAQVMPVRDEQGVVSKKVNKWTSVEGGRCFPATLYAQRKEGADRVLVGNMCKKIWKSIERGLRCSAYEIRGTYCKSRTRPFMTTRMGETIFPFSSPHRISCTEFRKETSNTNQHPRECHEGTRSGRKGRDLEGRVPIAHPLHLPPAPHPPHPPSNNLLSACIEM